MELSTTAYVVQDVVASDEHKEAALPTITALSNSQLPTMTKFLLLTTPGARLPRACYSLLNITSAFQWIPIFSYLTHSTTVGIVFGTWLTLIFMILPLAVPLFNHTSPIMYGLVHKYKNKINNESTQKLLVFLLFQLVSSVLLFVLLILPGTDTDLLGGQQTKMWIIVGAWLGVVCFGLVGTTSGMLMKMMRPIVATEWEEKIQRYLQKTVELLLTTNDDVESGDKTKSDLLRRHISQQQKDVERWARDVNAAWSTIHGFNCFVLSTTIAISLFCLTIPVSEATTSNRAGALATVTVVIIFSLQILYKTFRSLSRPSRCWVKTTNRLFNDYNVQCAIKQQGWNREEFQQWLSQHELSAARLFGFRATADTMSKVGGAMVSVAGVVLYMLLREEVRMMTLL
jgi:hypothetical protein